MPDQKHSAAWEKDFSALGRKAETVHFVAKIWGVDCWAQDARIPV